MIWVEAPAGPKRWRIRFVPDDYSINITPPTGNHNPNSSKQKKRKKCDKCGRFIDEEDEKEHVCGEPLSQEEDHDGVVVEIGKHGTLDTYG